ncbi:MAG: hypothetical protein IJG56_02575, partial [Clostridia bacterium]|nr:hypothetical protein [Clostridia bacterium]
MSGKKTRKLLQLMALAIVCASVGLLMSTAFADEPAGANWQIVDVGGETVEDDLHLKKTVAPTGTENEFNVHIGVDAKVQQIITSTQITQVLQLDAGNISFYWGTPGNGLPDLHPDEEERDVSSGAVANSGDIHG